MGIAEYLDAKKAGKIDYAGREHAVHKAWIALGDSVADANGNPDYSKLEDKTTKKAAVDNLYSMLFDKAMQVFESTATDPDKKEEIAFFAFGFKKEDVDKYFNTAKDIGYGEFFGYLQSQNTNFNFFARAMPTVEKPKNKLSEDDTDDVIAHTGVVDKVDKSKMEVADLAALLDQFEEHEVISQTFLKDKKYYKEP
tara:strand:- start:28435 stop:29022 length:588 start_codon:yes stop_codon:yes gene_type:complete